MLSADPTKFLTPHIQETKQKKSCTGQMDGARSKGRTFHKHTAMNYINSAVHQIMILTKHYQRKSKRALHSNLY